MEAHIETMPSHWGPYLINGDNSGMEAVEIADCDAVVKGFGYPSGPVDMSEDSWIGHFDYPSHGGLQTSLANYTFLV